MANTGYKYQLLTSIVTDREDINPDDPDAGFTEVNKLRADIYLVYDTEFVGPNGEGLVREQPERTNAWPLDSNTLQYDVQQWARDMYSELNERDELFENREQLRNELYGWGFELPSTPVV